jgi:hypothetical protein
VTACASQLRAEKMFFFFLSNENELDTLSSIDFINQPLHVSGVFITHHQQLFTVYVQQLVCVTL